MHTHTQTSSIIFRLLLIISFFISGSSIAQEVDSNVIRQIQALINEKESRTPAEKKIDSQIIYAYKMKQGKPIAEGINTLVVPVEEDAKGRIKIDIKGRVTDQLKSTLRSLGAEIIFASEKYGNIIAWLPLENVIKVAELDAINHIDLWIAPVTDSNPTQSVQRSPKNNSAHLQNNTSSYTNSNPNGGNINIPTVGSITSEADVTHKAAIARSTYGVNGSGVKIGVMSDGIDGYATSQASGDLPAVINVIPGQAGGGSEGRAMLELVYDLAPGAELYFATAIFGAASFAQNILDLRAAGCDIIIDDITLVGEGVFQDDVVSQAINTVTASGALFFTSAANTGNKNDNQSGVWEGDFVSGGTLALFPGGTLHSFGAQNYDVVTTTSTRLTTLKWSDPLSLSGNDYDLFATNSAGTSIIASSTNIQDGNDNPYEGFSNTTTNSRLYILKKTSASIRALQLHTNRGRLSISTDGSIYGHHAVNSAFCVSATPAVGPYPSEFNSTNKVETFSADGFRRMFYYPNGTAITPGNLLFGTNGGTLLLKPDITAADGTSTATPGFSPFFGTSAAAPHAGAIAALVKSKIPGITPAQMQTALYNSAIDIENAGLDRDAGYGIIMADAAIQAGLNICTVNVAVTGNEPFCPGSIVTLDAGTDALNNLTEGFDAGSPAVSYTPSGWTQQNNSTVIGITPWSGGEPSIFPPQSGSGYIFANYNSTTGTNDISNWLISPKLNLSNGATFTFWTHGVNNGYADRMQLRMSTNGASTNVGTAATDVGDFTTLLLDINPTLLPTGYPTVWTQYSVTISGLTGPTTGRIAFRYFVTNGGPTGTNSDFVGIDNVQYNSMITYSWSNGYASQTSIVSSPGTYVVTVTDGYGCDGSATVNVISNPLSGNILFSEDFDNVQGSTAGGSGTYVFPSGWSLFNVDGKIPDFGVSFVNDAWERREDFAYNSTDSCAFSTSWYNPFGQADDWMVTPAINIGVNSYLKWNAVTYDPSYPDGYEVRLFTSPPSSGNLLSSTVLLTIGAENTSWTSRSISLSSYANQTVYIAYRNNSNDKFLLLIDDIIVVDSLCASNVTLDLKLYLEGHYSNSNNGLMDNFGSGGCLYINGISPNYNDDDTITVSMMDYVTYAEIDSKKAILKTDGTSTMTFGPAVVPGSPYYIKVRHRNSIQTWSANPVITSLNTSYDFSTAANKAFGSNMTLTGTPPHWAIYSGDISDANTGLVGIQDEIVDSQDYTDMENAVSQILSGYNAQDLTGDGIVESFDYTIMENNVSSIIFSVHP